MVVCLALPYNICSNRNKNSGYFITLFFSLSLCLLTTISFYYICNIHFIHPIKHLLIFKTSSRHVLKTSSTRLQCNNFTSSKTSWRRLEDVFKTSRKTSWRRLGRRKIVTLKTSWRRLEDMSWRRLWGKQNFYWWYLYLTNLNVYLTNLCFTNLYLTNLRRIQNASLRTQ